MAPSTQPSGADAVTSLLDPVVTAAGLVLEGVDITPAGKRRVVRVVVDLPEDRTGSLDLDAVAEVSRSDLRRPRRRPTCSAGRRTCSRSAPPASTAR